MERHHRLRRNADFQRVREVGTSSQTRFVIVGFASNTLLHNRYGLVTGKRLGGAVVRNRVRRLMREAIRQLHPRLQTGHDIVVVARLPLVGKPLADVQHIMGDALGRAGLLVESERQ